MSNTNVQTATSAILSMSSDELAQVIEAIKYRRAQLGKVTARALTVGAKVKFNGKRGLVVGTVTKIKLKNCLVKDDRTGLVWNVPASMLTTVETAAA